MLLSLKLAAVASVVFCFRGISHQDETFSPQIDSHSSKLAEAVYEQTRVLGPTPLQGRLNYLHQLGKVTLRDRKASLMSLPQQREEVEFAVSVLLLLSNVPWGCVKTDHACTGYVPVCVTFTNLLQSSQATPGTVLGTCSELLLCLMR